MSEGPLQRLYREQCQSPWLDNLRRDDIASGRLQKWIDSGIRGLTSNPTIFQKAITESDAYDRQIASPPSRGLDVEDLYWSLVCDDIDAALASFHPLFEESDGEDGFVSVEIDPRLAQDTDGTFEAAMDLWTRIRRPNAMIKIPATRASLPAIRSMIASGANVNVTLIFGLDRDREVMLAYINGLADREAEGLPVDSVFSVASFFISRVDTEIDRRLERIGSPAALSLRGKAAVAQARLAFRMFTEVFDNPMWTRLQDRGARLQRPLWASTSTKNPSYPDTMYVDQLIGPNTVNTLPETTISSFCDHGAISRTIDVNVDESARLWDALSQVGVDVDDVSMVLEKEGLAAFESSFNDVLKALASKRA